MPGEKPLAPLLAETRTLVAAPEPKRPESGPTVTQADVFISVQVRVLVPVLVRTKETGLGVNGPPGGPAEPTKAGVTTRLSGKSYASCNPLVVELAGEVALSPIPRLANADHSSARFAPPVSTRSA